MVKETRNMLEEGKRIRRENTTQCSGLIKLHDSHIFPQIMINYNSEKIREKIIYC